LRQLSALIRSYVNADAAEHIIEMNTIARFFEHALRGTLPSGRTPRTARISVSMVTQSLIGTYNIPPPPMQGGGASNQPAQRIFNAIGSQDNEGHMVLASAGLNYVKGAVSPVL
jgi:hypothetical protein